MTDIVAAPGVDTLPPAPIRGAAGFAAAVGAFLEALPEWGDQIEASGEATETNAQAAYEAAQSVAAQAAVAADAAGLRGDSTTTLTVDAGNKDITLTSAKASLLTANRQVALVLKSDASIKMFGNIAASPAPTSTTARVVVTSGGVFGSGSYSDWHVIDAAFFTSGATDEEEWAETTEAAASTPASRAAMRAKVALTMGATVTPNMNNGRRFTLACDDSFTLGAPTNAKVGQPIIITVTHTGAGHVLAVNTAWKRREGRIGKLSTTDGAVDQILGIILEVDGSGNATYVLYDVIRVAA